MFQMRKTKKLGLPVLAIDLGGTKILTAIISNKGQVMARGYCLTLADEGPEAVINRILSAIDHIAGQINIVDQLLKGLSEFIETFLSLLTNSISYVRLAAFAIAHGALGLSAAILATMIGVLPAYLMMNILVFLIEGLAILIQSMRLTYYEFFTKFYSGSGIRYKPFSLPPSLT